MFIKSNYKFKTLPDTKERIQEVKNVFGIGDNEDIIRNEKNNDCEFLLYGTQFYNYKDLLNNIETLYKTTYSKIYAEVEAREEEDCAYTYYIYAGNSKKDSLTNDFKSFEIEVLNDF